MSALDDIRRRVADCRSYNFGMWNADKLAHEDVPRLLGALDAILAACVTSEEHAAQFGDEPSVYVDYIRTAVNDALEAGK